MPNKITKNDCSLLAHVATYRLLTVSQLSALSQRSLKVVRRRMRALRNKNLISTKIRGYGRSRGRPEELILLTEEGTQFLKEKGILSGDVDYSMDKIVDSHFVDHELLINWFCIHLLQIERVNPELSVHYLNNHNSSSVAQGKDERPFLQERVPVDNSHDKFLEFIPDGVFFITNLKAEPPKTLLFFLEVDMSTETLASTDKNSKDVRQKIINYQALFHSGHYKRYERIFDASINGFRLLFLANTSARLASLCRLIKEMPPSDFVWLTDQELMFSHGLSAEIWVRGGRNNESLQSILGPNLACKAPVIGCNPN